MKVKRSTQQDVFDSLNWKEKCPKNESDFCSSNLQTQEGIISSIPKFLYVPFKKFPYF
jgi:hypothetical protein